MTTDLLPSYLAAAERAAREAGEILLSWFGRATYREKAPFDLITEADVASQDAIARALATEFPDIALLAEEGERRPGASNPTRWIVDPLDGTVNFAHGLPLWCVSIGLEVEGELAVGVIHVPTMGETFRAAHGQGAFRDDRPIRVSGTKRLEACLIATGFPTAFDRDADRQMAWLRRFSTRTHSVRRSGTSAWNLAMTAAGAFDVCYASGMHPWDAAAGVVLIREAGGVVTALDGSPFRLDRGGLLASNGRVHDAARAAIREAWPGIGCVP
jgi:myo-inositol-1(or 4)-monophosphatase